MNRIAVLLSMVILGGCGGANVESIATPTTGAGGMDAGLDGDGFASPPICTSGMSWTRGNHGSSAMNPGRACIACHTTMNGPPLTIAGTVYPTAHEPDLCDGADGATGARVVLTGTDGQTLTLTPNAAGNFDVAARLKVPFTAKVTYLDRERAMAAPQTSGDCNGCHTQNGANGAPGRILLP